MITDSSLHWWAIIALRLVAGIALATAAILLLDFAANSSAASAEALAAAPALLGTP
jgi:hypothetical protein